MRSFISTIVNATLWTSWSFKPRQFFYRCIRISVLTRSSYIKENMKKIISLNYIFLSADSKVMQIWKFSNESFQTELVDAYCVMPEPRVKLLLIATRPYSAILDAYAVITTLIKRSQNNFQVTVDRWKFNFDGLFWLVIANYLDK